jgi:N-acetylneuraminate synthase
MTERAAVRVIAEAGVNHDGSLERAHALVDAAADAGADDVKFQTFDARRLASAQVPKAAYQIGATPAGESQLEMLSRLELPRAWHAPLKAHAERRGLGFMSTAFDADSLAFLVALGVPRLKVPSGELTNGPLLWQAARSGLPLLVSTGMATLGEVEQALAIVAHALSQASEPDDLEAVWRTWSDAAVRARLRGHVTLLHCTSQYPTPAHEVNLRAMDTLAASFGLAVGYSDHTVGRLMPVAAVARGATVIEKHFTLDRTLPGPDHAASIEPDELRAMVDDIRALEQALGDGRKAPQPSEWDTRRAARQQVVAARPIAAGAVLCREDLTTTRNGDGLPATALWGLVGRRAQRAFELGEALS